MDYFDEKGCQPTEPEHTYDHQVLLMARFFRDHGFFAEEFHEFDLPPPASKTAVQDLKEREVVATDEKCAICLKPNSTDTQETFKILPCTHAFHSDCIIPWLQQVSKFEKC